MGDRGVFFDPGKTTNVRVEEKVVIGIVIGRRDFSDDALGGHGLKGMINAWDQGDARASFQLKDAAGRYGDGFLIDGNRDLGSVLRPGFSRPDLHRQPPPATDDVFLFLAVTMGRGFHPLLRVHEFFAILGLLGKID